MERLTDLYEICRQQLKNLERFRAEAANLTARNKPELRLKEKILEQINTATGDLLNLCEFITEAETCIDVNDLELLLELTEKIEGAYS